MTILKTTGFDPSIHGFHFRNRFSGLDIVHEIHDGLGDIAEQVSGDADFWKGWGLCGGMSWHALDRFYSKNPVPERKQTPDSTAPLFRVLMLRQFDSFHGLNLLAQCLSWQSRSEEKPWWDFRATTRRLTINEWPKVKESVDQGFPASLCLIRTQLNPSDNHQVLAVAYREDQGAGLGEIELYDPNQPDMRPTITIGLAGPDAGRAAQSTGERLRGFFVWPYDRTQRLSTAHARFAGEDPVAIPRPNFGEPQPE